MVAKFSCGARVWESGPRFDTPASHSRPICFRPRGLVRVRSANAVTRRHTVLSLTDEDEETEQIDEEELEIRKEAKFLADKKRSNMSV